MKLEIYKAAPAEEQVVRLRLVSDPYEETIALVAVDENGDIRAGGRLIRVSSGGKIARYAVVSPRLGFVRDSSGRIELEEED